MFASCALGASSPHGYARGALAAGSHVAATSHSNSVGRRFPAHRANAFIDGDVELAVEHEPEIAGVIPALGVDRAGGRLGVLVVPAEHEGARERDLSDASVGEPFEAHVVSGEFGAGSAGERAEYVGFLTPRRSNFVDDETANKWLDRERRDPWQLPKI